MSSKEEASVRKLANAVFDAVEAGDFETLKDQFAPSVEIWHNTDGLVVNLEQTVKTLAGLRERNVNLIYNDRLLNVFPGGFVQQQVLEGTRIRDGEKVRLPSAVICRVNDGKITRVDEYFDTGHVANL